jgi:hypothetical protein
MGSESNRSMMRRRYETVRRRPLVYEDAIQRAVFDHLRWRAAPGVFAFHVPNGGKRSVTEAAIFKGLGARAGVPDVIVIHRGRCYALELKTEIGRLTKVQAEAIAALERAGAATAVCRGLDAALHRLEAWGLLLRSTVVRFPGAEPNRARPLMSSGHPRTLWARHKREKGVQPSPF